MYTQRGPRIQTAPIYPLPPSPLFTRHSTFPARSTCRATPCTVRAPAVHIHQQPGSQPADPGAAATAASSRGARRQGMKRSTGWGWGPGFAPPLSCIWGSTNPNPKIKSQPRKPYPVKTAPLRNQRPRRLAAKFPHKNRCACPVNLSPSAANFIGLAVKPRLLPAIWIADWNDPPAPPVHQKAN